MKNVHKTEDEYDIPTMTFLDRVCEIAQSPASVRVRSQQLATLLQSTADCMRLDLGRYKKLIAEVEEKNKRADLLIEEAEIQIKRAEQVMAETVSLLSELGVDYVEDDSWRGTLH